MEIFFYLFATLIVISSFLVVLSQNPVYSVLWLIFAFCNGAGLMILLGAEFLAMILIVVYVGAVAVLFLFVIMMLDIRILDLRFKLKQNLAISILVSLVMFTDLALIILLGAKYINCHPERSEGSPKVAETIGDSSFRLHSIQNDNIPQGDSSHALRMTPNTHLIGKVLYTDFILPFQTAGIILFVAMISCITLSLRHREGVKRQDISKQIAKNKDNAIMMVNPKLNTGIEGIKYD